MQDEVKLNRILSQLEDIRREVKSMLPQPSVLMLTKIEAVGISCIDQDISTLVQTDEVVVDDPIAEVVNHWPLLVTPTKVQKQMMSTAQPTQ